MTTLSLEAVRKLRDDLRERVKNGYAYVSDGNFPLALTEGYLAMAELEENSLERLTLANEAADNLRLIDRIADEIGLPTDEELSLAAVTQALQSARLQGRAERDETGWLLEQTGPLGPSWWSLTDTEGEGGYFTKDSTKALRFARREDAQAYIDDTGWTEVMPTEHEWSAPSAAQPTTQEERDK